MALFAGRSGPARTTILLVTLAAGLLSTGIDLLEDHGPRRIAADHSDSANAGCHLIGYRTVRTAPCNACFFHKLLAQALVRAHETPQVGDDGVPHGLRPFIVIRRLEHNLDASRGPPAIV